MEGRGMKTTKKIKKQSTGESKALSDIITFLLKIPKARLFRNYNAVPYRPGKGFVRRTNAVNPKGIPDLIFHFKGKTIYFEVKKEEEYDRIMRNIDRYKEEIDEKSNEHLKNQLRIIEDLNSIGIPAFFVCSVVQVDTHLQNIFGIDYLN